MAGHNGDRSPTSTPATRSSSATRRSAASPSACRGTRSPTLAARLTSRRLPPGTHWSRPRRGRRRPALAGASTTPSVRHTNDFNGDGFSDILWRNDNGTLTVWLGQSTGGFNIVPVLTNLATSWHVAGTGDLNGDGRADLLLRNDNGSILRWDGPDQWRLHEQSERQFFGEHPTWHVAGTGDFNGDGRTTSCGATTMVSWRNVARPIDWRLRQQCRMSIIRSATTGMCRQPATSTATGVWIFCCAMTVDCWPNGTVIRMAASSSNGEIRQLSAWQRLACAGNRRLQW